MLSHTRPLLTVPTDQDGRLVDPPDWATVTTTADGSDYPVITQCVDRLDALYHCNATSPSTGVTVQIAEVTDRLAATVAEALGEVGGHDVATIVADQLADRHAVHGEMTDCEHDRWPDPIDVAGTRVRPSASRWAGAVARCIVDAHLDTDPATGPHHALLRQDEFWRTRDGRVIAINDMTTGHLVNILRWLDRSAVGFQAAHLRAVQAHIVMTLASATPAIYDDERWAARLFDVNDAFRQGPDDPQKWIAATALHQAFTRLLDQRGGMNVRNRTLTKVGNRAHRLLR